MRPDGLKSKLSVEAVSKTYRTRGRTVPVLDGITCAVNDGEFVALIGPSGCGKSTLLGILAGFDTPDEGEVLVDGAPVRQPSRKGVFLFQQSSLFPWLDMQHNVEFGLGDLPPAERRARAAHYISLVGLGGFETMFPRELSGGMQQRAELARALIVKPDILFMDEPFGSLDALTRLRVRGELLRILEREQHTVLLVTHDVDEALHLADRILVLSPRPARIQATINVTMSRPRELLDRRMVELKRTILDQLGVPDVS